MGNSCQTQGAAGTQLRLFAMRGQTCKQVPLSTLGVRVWLWIQPVDALALL
ncbi:hypothetical protein D3C76_1340750 [compost metagenome]